MDKGTVVLQKSTQSHYLYVGNGLLVRTATYDPDNYEDCGVKDKGMLAKIERIGKDEAIDLIEQVASGMDTMVKLISLIDPEVEGKTDFAENMLKSIIKGLK